MRKKFFSDLTCTHGRTCVYGRYAPERAVRATTNLDYRARIVRLFSKLEILGVFFFKLIHLIVVVAVAVAAVVVVILLVVVLVVLQARGQNMLLKINLMKRFPIVIISFSGSCCSTFPLVYSRSHYMYVSKISAALDTIQRVL